MKKYNILFCCALSQELKIVKNEIKKLNFQKLNINFLQTWVGNYNTIYSIKDYLNNNCVDFLINIWVCGKINKKAENDFFQVARIKNSSNLKESIVFIYLKLLNLNSILSSEKVITNNIDMIWENYVDMESYWFNLVSEKEKIPSIIIKKPFDFVSDESKKVDIEEMKNSLIHFDYENLLKEIDKYLDKNYIESINLDYYKDFFSFTFQEFEIFKKQVNRYKALYKKDFLDFFEQNKNLSKKDFLEIFDKT